MIAGKYSARALFYRISHGILDDETPMAVLVLEMMDSRSSGVIYTRDVADTDSDNLVIHSVWGQGELLVDGEISPDVIKVSKKDPGNIVAAKIAAKHHHMVLDSDLQTLTIDTKPHEQNLLSLDMEAISTLAGWGNSLETYFNQPQDIEWCRDRDGRLFILQSRALNIREDGFQDKGDEDPVIENNILSSGGESVCPGMGSGRVFRLEHLSQLKEVPTGSVLVAVHGSPQFVTVMSRINAVVIGSGSRASHFASIVREFGVAAVVNIDHGFHNLVHGAMVTVDGEKGVVYEGRAAPLMESPLKKEDLFQESSFMSKLRYILDFSTRLKLTDPASSSFVPEGCRSLHDIIRFIHETAVREMFLIGNRKGSRKKGAKKLIAPIPMLFYILDVGHGIRAGRENKKDLTPGDIASLPMKAVLKGLSDPGICWSETSHFDWGEYDRVVMKP